MLTKMASTLATVTILTVLALIACSPWPVSSQLCDDLDTDGCKLLLASKPDFCQTSPLAHSACRRTCGYCPLTCYHCPQQPVNDSKTCTTTKACGPTEFCMINTLFAHNGHMEHILSCIDKNYCNGYPFGFHAIGKRHVPRDLRLHCCHTDLCNSPDFTTTTLPPDVTIATLPGYFSCHSDIVFVVDESESVGFTGFRHVIEFIKDIVASLDIGTHGDQLSLLLFANSPHLQWYLNDYTNKADLLNALNYVPYHNGTRSTGQSLKYARNNILQFRHGDRPSAKNVVIVVTDGKSNNHTATVMEANKLQADGVRMIALGVGNMVNSELLGIAGLNSHVVKVLGYDHLYEMEKIILQNIC